MPFRPCYGRFEILIQVSFKRLFYFNYFKCLNTGTMGCSDVLLPNLIYLTR